MIEAEDVLEKLSFLIRLSLCRSSMPHLPFRLFSKSIRYKILHLLQNPYTNMVEVRHQPNHEVIFAWADACNYEDNESLKNVLLTEEQ